MKTLLILLLILPINNLFSQSSLKNLNITNEEELEFNSYGIHDEVEYQNTLNEWKISYFRKFSADTRIGDYPEVIQVLKYLKYKFEGSQFKMSAGEYYEMKFNEYIAQKETEKSNNDSNQSNKIYLKQTQYSSKMGYNSNGVLESSYDCIYENGEVLTIGASLFASEGCFPYIVRNK